jgi:Zn-dependent protease with chaperone function
MSASNLFWTALGLTATPSFLAIFHRLRCCEREADLGSVDLTGHKQQIQALEKLETIRKEYAPFSTWWSSFWFNRMFAAHPQTKDRIKYIEDYVPAQPVSAELAAEVAAA